MSVIAIASLLLIRLNQRYKSILALRIISGGITKLVAEIASTIVTDSRLVDKAKTIFLRGSRVRIY